MALNIYVTLENKESRHFQLVPEKFNWNNLVTILDLSQVSNQESLLVLYYRHPKKDQIGSVSNQSELDAVIDDLKTPYDALYFDINSDPTQPLVALSPFERLAQFVTDHQPLGHRLSRSVGLLASHIASSSQTNFDTEFEWLNQMASKRDRKLQKKELTEDSSLESEESDGSCKRSRRGRSEHFGKHRKHFGDGLFEHFEGPFGKHGKHFGGPFGKHGKHFDGSFA
ncbi:hypothetical protein G6F56_012296 [Rhizopus delemar]|nr:hypothetical protein G6F56_012296 [Rhizopus delemar]